MTKRLVAAGTAASFTALSVFTLYPPIECAKLSANRTNELRYVREVVLASLMYSADNDDRAPLALDWKDAISPYYKGGFELSNDNPISGERSWLKFNTIMSGARYEELQDPASTVLFAGGTENTSDVTSGVTVGFADGHAKWVSKERFSWGEASELFAAPITDESH